MLHRWLSLIATAQGRTHRAGNDAALARIVAKGVVVAELAVRAPVHGARMVMPIKNAIVQNEGRQTVEREAEHYNLDIILSVGYRVKSQQGIYFQRWANFVLKQHLVQGYTVNQKHLDTLKTVEKNLERADVPKIAGSSELLNDYLPGLEFLNDYDSGTLHAPAGKAPTHK